MAVMQASKHYEQARDLFSCIAGVLIIIPLAPFICKFIPPILIAGFNADLLIATLIAILLISLIFWILRSLLLPLIVIAIALLSYNQYRELYGFTHVLNDYKTVAYNNWSMRQLKQNENQNIPIKIFDNEAANVTKAIQAKLTYKDSLVRNFSVKHSLDYFSTYEKKFGVNTRYLSLFKYINQHFKYVPDAQRDEYYATPGETIMNGLGGDCDDHSILMASCLISIGATCRLVIIEGHIYPEIYAGNKKTFEEMEQAIIWLFPESQGKIYHHAYNGDYWINLDYTATHPGGPYAGDKIKLMIYAN